MSPWERGRKRNPHSAVLEYFKEDITNNHYMVCQVKQVKLLSAASAKEVWKICGQQIKIAQDGEKDPGTRVGNLKKHLQRQHPSEYEVVQLKEKGRTDSSSHFKKQPIQGQQRVNTFFVPEKVLVKHNMETFKAALVEMAVDNAFSLRVFSTKGFKSLVGDMAEKLHVSLDRDQIRSYVILAAKAEKERLKEELRGKFLYLKFDCATRIRTNYLGLNIRYVNKDKLPTTSTLKVVDTQSQHSAIELKNIIEKVLEDYEIPLEKVLCCVTDNASNMVKLVSTMNEDLKAAFGDQQEEDKDEEDTDQEVDEETFDLQTVIPPSIEL